MTTYQPISVTELSVLLGEIFERRSAHPVLAAGEVGGGGGGAYKGDGSDRRKFEKNP